VVLNSILHHKDIHPFTEKHAKFVDNVLSQGDVRVLPGDESDGVRHRRDSKIHLARRDSAGHLHRVDDHEQRVSLKMKTLMKNLKINFHPQKKSIMLPIIFTEDDNGEIQMEMDTDHVHVSNDNDSIEIVMDESEEEALRHYSLYDGWTRMTPQEISHWIDK
jgi:hypothetical protein